MKRRKPVFLHFDFAYKIFFCLLLLFAAGCFGSPEQSPADPKDPVSDFASVNENQPEKISEQTIEITDDLNRTVTLKKPERAASLIGSFTDLWLDANGKDTLAASAHDAWTTFELDLNEQVTDLGDVKNISMEQLAAVMPDLVIASAKNQSQLQLMPLLEQMEIPVLYFDVSDFEDYLRVFEQFAKLTGDTQVYEEKGTAQKEQIEALKDKAKEQESPSVLYLRASGSSVKVKNSKDSVLGEMLLDLNTENIADSGSTLLEELSMEYILAQNPDHIFLVYQGSDDSTARKQMEQAVFLQPAWQKLDAVKEGRVHVMDQRLYNVKPNDQWASAMEDLYSILYEKADAQSGV